MEENHDFSFEHAEFEVPLELFKREFHVVRRIFDAQKKYLVWSYKILKCYLSIGSI